MMLRETSAASLVVLVLVLLACAPTSPAQMVPSLGTVSNSTLLPSCPAALKFATNVNMTCYSATLTACSGDVDRPLTYGVATPSGPVKGTIVMLTGSGGTTASVSQDEKTLVQLYVGAGYQIVQVAWQTAWEYTGQVQGRTSATLPAAQQAF